VWLKRLLFFLIFCVDVFFLFSFFNFFNRKITINSDQQVFYKKEKQPFYVHDLYYDSHSLYLNTHTKGILKYHDKSFLTYDNLPKSPVSTNTRLIEGMWVEGNNAYFVTRSKLYKYTDNGIKNIKIKGVRGGSRLSSVAVLHDAIYLGTTFNGVYLKQGTNFITVRSGLPREKYSWGEYFYYGIKKLFVVDGNLFCLLSGTKKMYVLRGKKWRQVFPGQHFEDVIVSFNETAVSSLLLTKSSVLSISNKMAGHTFNPVLYTNKSFSMGASFKYDNGITQVALLKHIYPYKKKWNMSGLTNIISLYVNLDFVKYDDIDVIERFFIEKRVNSIVINFKDDTGNLIYDSKLDIAKKANASMLHPKLKMFMSRIRKYDPYVIARIVSFKDYRMFKYNSNQYAIWDPDKNKPWHVNKREYWVDPFSDFIVDYNISVAQELEKRKDEFNIKELQFDYIRMPSDRSVRKAVFRHRKPEWERYDILDNFLSKLNKRINIPYSMDIYGYNAIYLMGNVIGQDIKTISKYAPVICPMFYPSHFGPTYLDNRENSQEYDILFFGVSSAVSLSYNDVFIRPYLQAFSWHVKQYDYKYINNQINASLLAGAKGYGFWNPGSKYHDLYLFTHQILSNSK
jgi:hypothetical protein